LKKAVDLRVQRHVPRRRKIADPAITGTMPVPFLIQEACMTTQSKTKDAKPASNGKAATNPAVILFGLDDYEKPKAAWFSERDAELAIKAAEQLHLNSLKISSAVPKDLIEALPAGHVHSSGALIPHVRRDLYEKVRGLAGPLAGQARGLPRTWDDIDVGHLVIAYENSEDGWWEAIVVDKNKDMLTLRWRDYPKQATVLRHRSAVALLKPSIA
jgi:hypothetical protein